MNKSRKNITKRRLIHFIFENSETSEIHFFSFKITVILEARVIFWLEANKKNVFFFNLKHFQTCPQMRKLLEATLRSDRRSICSVESPWTAHFRPFRLRKKKMNQDPEYQRPTGRNYLLQVIFLVVFNSYHTTAKRYGAIIHKF